MMMAFIWIRKNCPPAGKSTKRNRFAILLLSLTAGFSSFAAAFEPTPYSLQYQVETKGFNLKTTRELKAVDDNWQISQVSRNMFLKLQETSLFSTDESGNITSQSYNYQRKVIGHNKRYQLSFDNEKHQAHYYRKKSDQKTIDYELPVYDALNYQLLLRKALSENGDQEFSRDIPVVERKRLRSFQFKVIGEELLETEAGLLRTLKLERVRSKKSKQTYIWLAKDWDYLVVKMLHLEDDEAPTTLTLKAGELGGKSITGIQVPGRL